MAFEYLEVSNIRSADEEKLNSFKNGGQHEDLILDSLISYLNQQDWSYLKANNDWGWYGDIIIIFNKKGFVKRVRSDFHSGYTHQDDIYLRTADRLKRQVRKTLKQGDLSHLNPPPEYKVKIALKYTSANREVVWSRGNSRDEAEENSQ
jgi:hypothetical protein